MVFTVADATFAAPIPYPDFVRRSRQVRQRLESTM